MAARLSPTLVRSLAAAFLGVSSLAAIAGIVTGSLHLRSSQAGSSGGSASGGYVSGLRAEPASHVVDGGLVRALGLPHDGGSFASYSGVVAGFGGDDSLQFGSDRARAWPDGFAWNSRFDDRGFTNPSRGNADGPPWAPSQPPIGFRWTGDSGAGSAPGWDPQWWISFGDRSGPQLPPIPEPQVVTLLILGSAMVGAAVRRRRRT